MHADEVIARCEAFDRATRLYHAIALYADKSGVLRTTQAELAELLGASQQWVSKKMRELEQGGILVRDHARQSANSPLIWRLNEKYGWKTSVAERNEKVEKRRAAPYPKPRPSRVRRTDTGRTLRAIDGGKTGTS